MQLQSRFNDPMFLYHHSKQKRLYIDLDALKEHDYSVVVYYIPNNK